MNDARPSNRIRALRALLSTIVPIIAGLGALAVVAQSEAPPKKTIPLHNPARLLGVDEAVAVKDPDLAKASHDLLEIRDEYQASVPVPDDELVSIEGHVLDAQPGGLQPYKKLAITHRIPSKCARTARASEASNDVHDI